MKKILLTTAFLMASATLASADTIMVQGCEVVKATNGNYYNLVDVNCKYAGSAFDPTGAEEKADLRRAAAREAAEAEMSESSDS